MVTWYVGSWWWVCPIACWFIHNYSRYLEPKLKHADGPGWTGVYRQGASGRGENVGQPRSACFLRREEDSGAEAEAAATAAAERRRLQRLAVVSLRGAEGGCSNTAYTDRFSLADLDHEQGFGCSDKSDGELHCQVENYVLLLVLLSVFAGGTLVLLSLLLLFCHRCCMGGRRYSRASDDLEKTNTTYAEDSQPTQEITVHLDESDALSAASCHDGESERFVSTGYAGRRVSFNESALYEKEKTAQSDKVRRYTLTEGDFHHLKKARLTHLHLPPAPCDLKILTIMECDSAGSSTNNISSEATPPNLPVTIYQPSERLVLDWTGQGLSGGLPGDTRHSTILEPGPGQASLTMKKRSQTMEAVSNRGETEKPKGARTHAPGQTSVLHFLSKLRRHASLEGAGPYFKRWKFDSSHRAASLDAKGSPKRRFFQRQRAASETTDHTEDCSPMRDEVIDSIRHTPIQAGGLQALSAESLSHRLNLEVGSSGSSGRGNLCSPTPDIHAQRPKEATEHVTGEDDTQFGRIRRTEVTGEEEKTKAAVQERTTQNKDTEPVVSHVRKRTEEEVEDESVSEVVVRGRADSGSSLSFMIRQESLEAAPSLYRDIWSLRASLEQYVSSDQSSTDHESVRSDADSVSSPCGAGARSGLDSCLSQDLDDDPEGDTEADVLDGGTRGDSDMGSGAGGEAEAGNRKLLQMDSGYASIEAPSRAPEEMRLFGTPGAPRGKTASERRMFFTSSGRKGSVCESIEAKLFQEELEDEMMDGAKEKPKIYTQPCPPADQLKSHQDSRPQLVSPVMKVNPSASSPHKPRLRRRDYSIDEKTDALFNEFLRHDPRFDQQDSPMRARHRSRVHLRKQWQRHKQYSDPGSGAGGRYSPSLERQRFTPLRRGDSAGYPLDTRYHSTLSRIASAADEEASEVAACEEAAKESVESNERASEGDAGGAADTSGEAAEAAQSCRESSGHGDGCHAPTNDIESTISRALTTVAAQGSHLDPRVDNRNNNSSQAIFSEVSLPAESDLTDKLVASMEERLYDSLRGQGEMDQVLQVSNTASPGFSPS